LSKFKNNHFVAKSIVSQFKGLSNQVIYWDKLSGGKLEPRNPRSVHSVDYLYSKWNVNGVRDSSAEIFLAEDVDNSSRSKIDEIVTGYHNNKEFVLTDSQREFLAKLLIRTVMRNPTLINHASRLPLIRLSMTLSRIARFIERGFRKDAAYDRYGRERVLLGEVATAAAQFDLKDLGKEIENRGFHFCIPNDEARNFILGSQPFIINTVSNTQGKSAISDVILSPGNEVYLVLHPRIILKVYGTSDSVIPIVLDDEDMKRINGLFVKYSNSVVAVKASDLQDVWYKDFGKETEDGRMIVTVSDDASL